MTTTPEDRVAEELQPLVGGQATVLVGERPVGQGALEQRRVEHRVAERLTQVLVVLHVERRCSRAGTGQRTGRRFGTRAVLAALRARTVRQVLGTAGRVGAGHQRRRDGLPLRAAVASVAPRRLPLRDSHCDYSSVGPRGGQLHRARVVRSCWSRPVLVGSCGRALQRRPAGSTASSCRWSGSSASRAPHSMHSPGQSSWHSGWNGSASTTASRSSGSRSTRSPSNRLVSSSSVSSASCSVVVDEELLEVRSDLTADLLQAPDTLALQPRVRGAGDEHALDDRLEPDVELDG